MHRRAVLELVVVVWACLGSNAFAATVVPGGNIVDQVWTPAGSPYTVQGDITVPSGAFLTIEAGTVVEFATSDALAAGLDTTRVEMTIQGKLTIPGSTANPALLRSQSGGAGANAWYGIVIGATANTVSIAGARIEQANQAIRSSVAGAVLNVNATTIDRSTYGALVLAGTPSFTDVTVTGSTIGFQFSGSSGGTVTRAIVRSNSSHGIVFSGASGSPVLNVLSSTIHANGGDGVQAASGSLATASLVVKNSIVTQNNRGLARVGSAAFSATYNDVWSNSTNYSGVTAGTGSISSNPIYVSSPSNLRLTANSPARFGADTGSDLGALPFSGDPTPGNYGTLWTSATYTASGSPYTVAGDLTVAPGVTLTLEPGVTFSFATSDLMGAGVDATRPELRVLGTLSAQGTPASRVVLTSAGTGVGRWYGVMFLPGSTGSVLSHADVDEAVQGIHLDAASPPAIADVEVFTSQIGVLVQGGAPTLTRVASHGNTTGFQFGGVAGGTLSSCIARSNSGNGVLFSPTSGAPVLNVLQSTLHGNGGDGLQAAGSVAAASVLVKNSIVSQNNRGLYRAGSPAVTATHNDVWGNLTDYQSVTPGTGSISSNPLYVSTPTNLRLTSNSPARFGGDTGADLGALPYAGDPTPGNYGTLWTSTTFSSAGSPYALAGDLTVAPGVTLTVEPGVTLEAATSDFMTSGTDLAKVELRVLGRLVARGTSGSPILFGSAGAAPGAWYGVLFLGGSDGSVLERATIEEAVRGITHDTLGAVTYSDLVVRTCGTGVHLLRGAPVLAAVLAHANTDGVVFAGSSGGSIVNGIVRENGTTGIAFLPTSGSPTLTVECTTVHGNGFSGIRSFTPGPPATLRVRNSIVTASNYGIRREGPEIADLSYNDLWANASGDYFNCSPGAGSISADPGYVAPPTDLRLSAASPSIDAAASAGAPRRDFGNAWRPVDGNADGTILPDMGAWEYPVFPASPGTVAETVGGPTEPLFVSKSGPTNLSLRWGAACGTSASDYAIYEGTIGTWYGHLPATCSTAGGLDAILAMPAGSAYYLVVPLSASEEGGYGRDSAGNPIPVGATRCRATQNLGGCR